MSNFKKVENILYNYKYRKIYIDEMIALKEELEKGTPATVKAICMDAIKTSNTYNFSSIPESGIVDKSKKIDEIEIEIYTLNRNNRIVEKTLDVMKDVYKDLFQYKYIDEMPLYSIAQEMHLSEREVCRKRNQLVEKMEIALFGVE